MFNIKQKSNLLILSVLAILSLSTIMPALVFGAPLDTSADDWVYVNANSWGWNYSPQSQINKDNVNNLEVKWIYPLEGSEAIPAAMNVVGMVSGSTTPPIVVDGKVFITTNFQKTYGVDAASGQQLWAHQYLINAEDVQKRLPISWDGMLASIASHIHGIRYWEGENSLLMAGLACDFYGIDIETGETSFWVKDLCVNVPGNMYNYRQGSVSQTNIGTYEKGRQFIYVLPGIMHMSVFFGDFRHTTLGIDMDTHEVLWRLYSFPPHGVLTKDWALQECDIGYFRDIPCSTVAAQAPENLEWDWAKPNQPPSILGGVTANWGEIVIDEDSGIAYTNTGNQGPFSYIGDTPGPRLYGSTIMAIDLESGQRIWWQQPMPRDPYDYDCNWGGILAENPTLGKVYMKGCKEGRLFMLDAETGEPIRIIDVVDEQFRFGQITVAGTKEYQEGGIKYRTMDPLNHYDMREMEAPDGSPYCGDPCEVYPFWSNGIFGTDFSYDPLTNTLYNYETALQVTLNLSPRPPYEIGDFMSITTGYPTMNTTLVARDVTTGEVKWHWYYDASQQRSHMVVSDSLLWAGFTDGFIRFFDKNTGTLLNELNIGSDIKVGTTTGTDSNGDQKIFLLIGQGSSALAAFSSGRTPGSLIAFGLNEKASSGSTTTVTTTAINTVTKEVSSEGLSPTITYAAVAVAVIAVIAAAVLFTRKTK